MAIESSMVPADTRQEGPRRRVTNTVLLRKLEDSTTQLHITLAAVATNENLLAIDAHIASRLSELQHEIGEVRALAAIRAELATMHSELSAQLTNLTAPPADTGTDHEKELADFRNALSNWQIDISAIVRSAGPQIHTDITRLYSRLNWCIGGVAAALLSTLGVHLWLAIHTSLW